MTDRQIDRLVAFCILAGTVVLSVCMIAGVLTGTW